MGFFIAVSPLIHAKPYAPLILPGKIFWIHSFHQKVAIIPANGDIQPETTGVHMKILLSILVILIGVQQVQAQDTTPWNGKKAAVSLTYDDALNVHLDNVVPALDALGLKGTFYLTSNFTALKDRPDEWGPVAANGHELGNHTMFHPCEGGRPGREFVNPDYDLNNYSVQRMVDEIVLTNLLLSKIDGKLPQERTLAYPCGDMNAGGNSYVDAIRGYFVAARGVQSRFDYPGSVDLFNIGAFGISGQSGKELIALVDRAIEEKALLVFLFHGVGGEHGLNVSLEAHQELIEYLKAKEEEVWVGTMVDVAEFVKEKQER